MKERILSALRSRENLVLGQVQRSGQNLRVHYQVVWNVVDLRMVAVTLVAFTGG